MRNADLVVAVLAAAASRRLGRPKQLAIVDGESLLRGRCRRALAADVGPVIAVLGCEADQCSQVIADLPVEIRRNDDWAEGMSASLRHAADAARAAGAAGLLILMCDQYLVTADDLKTLRDAWVKSPTSSCITRAGQSVGPPVIVPADCYGALQRLRGDRGARSVLYDPRRPRPIEIDNPRAVQDVDSLSDLENAQTQ